MIGCQQTINSTLIKAPCSGFTSVVRGRHQFICSMVGCCYSSQTGRCFQYYTLTGEGELVVYYLTTRLEPSLHELRLSLGYASYGLTNVYYNIPSWITSRYAT